ncbi:putative DNA polymerase [Stylophora pistillata]|uniref:DNA-directed DNA polymerase n=2 Tax=Stylophora pistillata TaxID=50429 RepID=A0A2B4RUY4_STYPI|nr:putative DNA polymerase [Stylophora pistillata]
MVKEKRRFEFIIPNGTKNLCMQMGKIVYKDSMRFLPMALSAFSSTYGIPEHKKGFFPHKFNTPENQNYVGPLPAAKYYDPAEMSEKKKIEFETWYMEEQSKNLTFDLKKELVAYCRSDVKLLKAGCLKFTDEFKTIAKFDPMEKCVTIAQACNRFGGVQVGTRRDRDCVGGLFGGYDERTARRGPDRRVISAGAKNYGYVTAQGKSCVKVKGFSLNARGIAQLNYEVMKQNILDEIRHPLDESRKTEIVNPLHFVRDPVMKKTETQIKAYRLVFDKRVMDSGTFRSLPYGYQRLDDEDLELANLLVS